jgi:glutamate racemase
MLSQVAKIIVVACNTASAAALHYLRELFPFISFVGMEPAVKPAAETTQTGKVGVLATPTTFAGELFASVVERFAKDVEIFKNTCPGLVEQIEMGDLESETTRAILEDALNPMLNAGIDTVVLGCTHYPFVIPLIKSITGPDVRTIDPAPAIARQVHRVLKGNYLLKLGEDSPDLHYFTTESTKRFELILGILLGETGKVSQATWVRDDDEKCSYLRKMAD